MERLRDPAAFPPQQVDVTSNFDRASVEAVSKVHSPDYVQFLHELSKEVSPVVKGQSQGAAAESGSMSEAAL